jgi:hypothetical protein
VSLFVVPEEPVLDEVDVSDFVPESVFVSVFFSPVLSEEPVDPPSLDDFFA